MTHEELYKLVNHELDFLRYYAYRATREILNINSNLYDVMISIGYTKRVIPLDRRCPAGMITVKGTIDLFDIEDLENGCGPRNHQEGRYTPLEIFWIKFPERRQEVIDNLLAEQINVKKIA